MGIPFLKKEASSTHPDYKLPGIFLVNLTNLFARRITEHVR